MDVMQAILGRHSVRAFRETPVSREAIDKLVAAAAAAPSPRNSQPWEFHIALGETRRKVVEVVAQTTVYLAEYVDMLTPEQLQRAEEFYSDLGCAPLVVAVSLPLTEDRLTMTNEYISAGAAIENLLLAATGLGLGACNITAPVWVRDELMNVFQVGEGREIVSLLVVGEPAEAPVAPPHRQDVGVILDIGVHDIDIISYLYNTRVSEVYAIAGKEIHSFEDHASMFLRYDGDRAGIVEVNWLTPHKTRKFTVIGTEGVAYGDYMEQRVTIHDKEWVRDAKIERREPLSLELESFLDACRNHKEPVTTGPDGIHALDVAIAAIDSYKSRSMVKIYSGRYALPRAEPPTKATV
jgi:nitroreductase